MSARAALDHERTCALGAQESFLEASRCWAPETTAPALLDARDRASALLGLVDPLAPDADCTGALFGVPIGLARRLRDRGIDGKPATDALRALLPALRGERALCEGDRILLGSLAREASAEASSLLRQMTSRRH
jgi:hypothetical protein